MLTRIVDPVLCHQHAVPTEVGHALTRHPEVLDDTGDGLQGLVRREIQCCAAGIAVEDHVEVLVGGDPGQQSVGDRVTACFAGIAVADPGGELLEGDVRERQQEVGFVTFFLFGGRSETVGHMRQPGLLKGDRIDSAGHDKVVTQGDAVPALLGSPASHPGSPCAVQRKVFCCLAVVGRQIVLG